MLPMSSSSYVNLFSCPIFVHNPHALSALFPLLSLPVSPGNCMYHLPFVPVLANVSPPVPVIALEAERLHVHLFFRMYNLPAYVHVRAVSDAG
ncbi:hypothetical protein B0H17DRAFT_1208127 [Mycena rosella]|uniref:Uncharacterized protein n=1 Tax=Mycena rosella TaxID=1033263 RepID=A0AAD7G7F2_MYCRO|nr:hypothetical protein B0H17DRAFT_1208127 [Mycena rosella]